MSIAITKEVDNTIINPSERPPLVVGMNDYTTVTETVAAVAER
ncbi:MAG: hypothetical protein R3C11_05270 [Planctomycetaceae bacterium]